MLFLLSIQFSLLFYFQLSDMEKDKSNAINKNQISLNYKAASASSQEVIFSFIISIK